MRAWLESIRTNGATVGTDLSEATSFSLRRYEINQGVSGNLDFTIPQLGRSAEQGNVIEVGLFAVRSAGSADYDSDFLSETLRTTTVTIGGTATLQKPLRGNFNIPIRANEILFGDDNAFSIINGVPLLTVHDIDSNDDVRIVPVGNGRIVTYNSLPLNASGVTMFPTPRERPLCDEIHFPASATAPGTTRMQNPPALAGYGHTAKPFTLVNLNATHAWNILDWTGTTGESVVNLLPGEHAHFRFTYNHLGGGELIGEVPAREALWVAGSAGNFGSTPWWQFDSPLTRYMRMVPLPGTAERFDTDAFRLGTNTFTANGQFADATVFDTENAVVMEKDGLLRLDHVNNIETSGTGNIPDGHGVALYQVRGGTPTEIDFNSHAIFTSDSNSRPYRISAHLDVLEDDIVFVSLRYPTGTSLGVNNAIITSLRRSMILEPTIRQAYTP